VATDIAQYITSGEASRRLGVSQTYVNMLFNAGKLTGIRTTYCRLIDPDSVDRMKEERASSTRQTGRRRDKEVGHAS
jgi:excisionase family DNA binding protein